MQFVNRKLLILTASAMIAANMTPAMAQRPTGPEGEPLPPPYPSEPRSNPRQDSQPAGPTLQGSCDRKTGKCRVIEVKEPKPPKEPKEKKPKKPKRRN